MYNISLDDRAEIEIDEAAAYYGEINPQLTADLFQEISHSYSVLETEPHFRKINYRLRSYKIRKFPYSIIYGIDEGKQIITIYSFFHSKRDPNERPE